MHLKPPPVAAGAAGIAAFFEQARLRETYLTTRYGREAYRADLARWRKYYSSLAARRDPGSKSEVHFINFAALCERLLDDYGPEPPPKKRTVKRCDSTLLIYPNFPEEVTHRLHFLAGPGARRQRLLEMASTHAPFMSTQTSGTGRVLVSIGTHLKEVRLFQRFVETIGEGALTGFSNAGFLVEFGRMQWPGPPITSAEKIAQDNQRAHGYSWQARAVGDRYRGHDGGGLPRDASDIRKSPPWDPEPRWQEILDLTQADELTKALALVDAIPGREREALLDEVFYLRFLTSSDLRADDVRLLVRKYAATSRIAGRLLDEFEVFVGYVDQMMREDPPNLGSLGRLDDRFGQGMIPGPPPARDWAAYRAYEAQFTNPSAPRGRIFSVNIDVGFSGVQSLITEHLLRAEGAFRRDRGIPEVGENGWISECALRDLFRVLWPDTQHQWRPWFLGRQSIDIYIPDINLAVEYQGQQHFDPIPLFGGAEGLRDTQARDARKRMSLEANNVRLLEWRYDEPINMAALTQKLIEMEISLPAGHDPTRYA